MTFGADKSIDSVLEVNNPLVINANGGEKLNISRNAINLSKDSILFVSFLHEE